MRKNRNYSEDIVVAQLCRKNDCRVIKYPTNVKLAALTIFILLGSSRSAKGDIGIRSKGKIDFLKYQHGYHVVYVDNFSQVF